MLSTSGVPRGSVLGPLGLLFTAYINDLDVLLVFPVLRSLRMIPSHIYREVCSKLDATSFQSELDSILNWLKNWGMFFNIDKCKDMHISSRNRKNVYNANGRDLSVVQTENN